MALAYPESQMGVLASGCASVAACLSEIPGPHLGGRCALTSLGQSQLAVCAFIIIIISYAGVLKKCVNISV